MSNYYLYDFKLYILHTTSDYVVYANLALERIARERYESEAE